MAALYLLLLLDRHIVAQVVEAEFAVGPVSYVAAIGREALLLRHKGRYHSHREPHSAVDGPHPGGVARREVVVYRDDVNALPSDRVKGYGERRDERLSLARLHLGDISVVKHHAAYQLLLEVAQPQRAL